MAIYDNLSKKSPLTAVEFSPVSDGNFSFYYIDSPVKRDLVKKWLTSEKVGQEIVAETSVDGRPVLVTHGDKSQEEMMKLLEEQGDHLAIRRKEKSIDPWAARSVMSVAGQSLQLVSALARVAPSEKNPGTFERKVDKSFFMFAGLNMLANVMNFVFGSQKTDDDHHLADLKEQFNSKIDSHLPAGEECLDVDDKRAGLRREPPAPKSTWDHTYDFLQRNSVTVGEIGLRYAAAVGLVFPMFKAAGKEGVSIGWREMGKHMLNGELSQAFKGGLNKKNLPLVAGGLYLFGKTIALASKVKDPYDPKPHTWIDTVREDYIFKAGSIIEAVAGTVVSVNAFQKNKLSFGSDLKPMRDWAGTVGGGLFAAGYIIRYYAKYGEKQMNMDELHAHISDNLAKVPPEQLPQMMAECAATLTDHFKDKGLEFGKVYNQIMTDMYRYHHIALDNLGTEPEERNAKVVAQGAPQAEHAPVAAATADSAPSAPAKEEHKHSHGEGHAHKHQPRKTPTELASVVPSSSHVEKAAQAASEVQHSLGA